MTITTCSCACAKACGCRAAPVPAQHYPACDRSVGVQNNWQNPASGHCRAAVGFFRTARELRAEGNFGDLSEGFNPETYSDVFASIGEGAVSVSRPTDSKPAVTATKTTPAPKKRGRKGTKIAEAFGAIGTEAVPAEEFANTRGVSLNVLRQAKRFDKTGGARVRVKKIDGTLMVYRESE